MLEMPFVRKQSTVANVGIECGICHLVCETQDEHVCLDTKIKQIPKSRSEFDF